VDEELEDWKTEYAWYPSSERQKWKSCSRSVSTTFIFGEVLKRIIRLPL